MSAFFDLLRRVCLLLCKPEALLKETLKRHPSASTDDMRNSISKLRAKILRGFKIVTAVVVFTLAISWVLDINGVEINHQILTAMRVFGYSAVLWGVLSPVGYGIRTFDGETLPEVLDEEWHRLLYAIGLFLLLLSYLSE